MSMLCAAFCDVVLSAGIFVGVSGGYERDSEWGSREQGTLAQKQPGTGNISPKTAGNREHS